MMMSRPLAGIGAAGAVILGGFSLYAGSSQYAAADTNKSLYGQTGYAGQDTVQTTTGVVGDTLLGAGGLLLAAGGFLGHKALFPGAKVAGSKV